jgi:hypothetical protein
MAPPKMGEALAFRSSLFAIRQKVKWQYDKLPSLRQPSFCKRGDGPGLSRVANAGPGVNEEKQFRA